MEQEGNSLILFSLLVFQSSPAFSVHRSQQKTSYSLGHVYFFIILLLSDIILFYICACLLSLQCHRYHVRTHFCCFIYYYFPTTLRIEMQALNTYLYINEWMSPTELSLMLALHSGILLITYDRVPTSVDFYLFLTSVFIYNIFQ